ncbi:MAG: DUF6273 domain-containing protein [Firmicutes bacterium]|nr:DUF6273 domain-containing protein [Bacillota bacterium]
MNYSKLALLKTEELETRLNEGAGQASVSKASILDIRLNENMIKNLTSIKGKDLAGIFISIKFDKIYDGATIFLMLDGKVAASEIIDSQTVSLKAAVDLDAEIKIGLKSDKSIKILRVDILTTGRANFSIKSPMFKACDIENSFGLVKINNGEIRVFISDDRVKRLNMNNSLLLGFGDNADICGLIIDGQPAYAVVFKDRHSNAFLAIIRLDGDSYKIINSAFLKENVASVALSYIQQTGIVFGFIKDDIAYAGMIGDSLNLVNVQKIDKGDRINFVKKSNPVVAHFMQGNRNLIRVCENEINAGFELDIDISAALADNAHKIPPPISKGLENDSWNIIAAISSAISSGLYYDPSNSFKNPYTLGDQKTITLTNGEQITLEILGFNHDDKSDGSGKAGITFGMRNLMSITRRMNPPHNGNIGAGNLGGWEHSEMRNIRMQEIFDLLPQDLQESVLTVNKLSGIGGLETTQAQMATTQDRLFLLSTKEVSQAAASSEGATYELYARPDLRQYIKQLNNGQGVPNQWWTRSTNLNNRNSFLSLNANGFIVVDWFATNSFGVCFGFCV